MENFKALVVDIADKEATINIKQSNQADLDEGNVLIEVAYSSVNYKDALATVAGSGVVRKYPIIPGIDLSGIVVESSHPSFQHNDHVLVTGYGLGVSHHGGYSQYAKLPAEWIVPIPKSLSLKTSMMIGTAGFTAALAIQALEDNGLKYKPNANILVTGASGGVGSIAIAMLKQLGYQNISALSRKKQTTDHYFVSLGASQVISIEDITPQKKKPILSQQFDYVIDTVGGTQLEIILPQLSYNGCIALCGNAGGISFSTTVLPFILRGIHCIGIDSVQVPMEQRKRIWNRIATELLPENIEQLIADELSLEQLPQAFHTLLHSKMIGRFIVNCKK